MATIPELGVVQRLQLVARFTSQTTQRHPCLIIAIGLAACVLPTAEIPAQSQTQAQSQTEAQAAADTIAALVLTPQWSTDRAVDARTVLSLRLSRSLAANREQLALLIGNTDVSALLEVRGQDVHYRSRTAPLPTGPSDVAAFLVDSAGEWHELARFPLRVRGALGLETRTLAPSIDLSGTSIADEFSHPDATLTLPARALVARIGAQSHATRNGWTLSANGNALATSDSAQRLRWNDLQHDAPMLDLADYVVRVERTSGYLALGHLTAGRQRHLLQGFASRGVGVGARAGRVASVSAEIVNGTDIVGWGNPVGVMQPDHRIGNVSLGVEFRPARPGFARLEVTGMDGSLRPLTGFTQGAVTDAERSRGGGVHLALGTSDNRARAQLGLTRSRFTNPFDPQLAGDTTIVAVQHTTRSARFLDVTLAVLRPRLIAGRINGSLDATVRHERVDPLYRSVGANVQADMEQHAFELTGVLGAATVRGALRSSQDNLARIPSILRTRMNGSAFDGAVALSSLFARPQQWLLPQLTFASERLHQVGDGIPVDGEFAASHVPNQLSRSHNASATWTTPLALVAWRWNGSHQDNRQPGRERSDFTGAVHAISVGHNGASGWTTSIDGSVEHLTNVEQGATQRVQRIGSTVRWTPWNAAELSTLLSHSWTRDPDRRERRRNLEVQAELSQGLTLYRRSNEGTQGRLFIRYGRTSGRIVPLDAAMLPIQLRWTWTTGGSFRIL